MKVIKQFVCGGVAGKRTGKMKGIVLHNCAGSVYATAEQYLQALSMMTPTQLAKGFAHFYVDRFAVVQVEDVVNKAWHTANPNGNANYIGYEVCQSMGANQADFLANEQAALRQIAKDMQAWGLTPNRSTVKLHQEFSPTSCPHRTWALHGNELNKVKDYLIQEIQKYMNETNAPVTVTTKGEITMVCLYEKDNSIYYFDGTNTKRLTHPDEARVLKDIYRRNNGKEMPYFDKNEWNKNAPWYARLEQVAPLRK